MTAQPPRDTSFLWLAPMILTSCTYQDDAFASAMACPCSGFESFFATRTHKHVFADVSAYTFARRWGHPAVWFGRGSFYIYEYVNARSPVTVW